jgi:hypothetical protein
VPHWPPERAEVTLHQVLVHMIAETHRHAGHADIIREVIDGAVGLRADNDNMAPGDEAWWDDHRGRLERAARSAADPASEHRRPATRGRAPRTGRTLAVTGTVLDVASTVRAGPAVSGPGSGPRASRRRP